MKITNTKEAVILTSETVAEAKALASFFAEGLNGAVEIKKRGRPVGSKSEHNPWKGKHKVKCSFCGAEKKNIRLHIHRKHQADIAKASRQAFLSKFTGIPTTHV